jgi:hypothetical protein
MKSIQAAAYTRKAPHAMPEVAVYSPSALWASRIEISMLSTVLNIFHIFLS